MRKTLQYLAIASSLPLACGRARKANDVPVPPPPPTCGSATEHCPTEGPPASACPAEQVSFKSTCVPAITEFEPSSLVEQGVTADDVQILRFFVAKFLRHVEAGDKATVYPLPRVSVLKAIDGMPLFSHAAAGTAVVQATFNIGFVGRSGAIVEKLKNVAEKLDAKLGYVHPRSAYSAEKAGSLVATELSTSAASFHTGRDDDANPASWYTPGLLTLTSAGIAALEELSAKFAQAPQPVEIGVIKLSYDIGDHEVRDVATKLMLGCIKTEQDGGVDSTKVGFCQFYW